MLFLVLLPVKFSIGLVRIRFHVIQQGNHEATQVDFAKHSGYNKGLPKPLLASVSTNKEPTSVGVPCKRLSAYLAHTLRTDA